MSADGTKRSGKPTTILVRGVNWLGDAIMTIPALEALREARPADSITLLSHSKLADLWKSHSAVDRVIGFDRSEPVWTLARRLRGERFDLALILPNSVRSALECFLARIPARIGYARHRGLFLTNRVRPRTAERRMRKRSGAEIRRLIRHPEISQPNTQIPLEAHHLHDYLHLVAALGAPATPRAPRVFVQPDEQQVFCPKIRIGADQERGNPDLRNECRSRIWSRQTLAH